jgi:ribonuclease HI
MTYKSEHELRKQAELFISQLRAAGITAEVVPGSFRDYQVKVSISRGSQSYGPAVLYHSPSHSSFSFKAHELRDKSIVPELQRIWDQMLASSSPGASKSPVAGNGYRIYVDGSFIDEKIGYGLVILKGEQKVAEKSGPVTDETMQDMRQIGGEITAVCEAIAWCHEHGVGDVSIYYDYEGLQRWAEGAWESKNAATQAYANAARSWNVAIRWLKVAAHSGDRWNEYVDQLAKNGAGQGTVGPVAAVAPTIDLATKAAGFVAFLATQDITAISRGIFNSMFVRIDIGPKQGYIDVYNTSSRPPSKPYLQAFKDLDLQKRVESLWQEYLGGGKKEERPEADQLQEVTYYYEILRPFRDCRFDFLVLAQAIHRLNARRGITTIDAESARYNFETLERAYIALKGEQPVCRTSTL